MNRVTAVGIALFLFIACADEGNNTNPILPLDHNVIQMAVGDSWLYRQSFIDVCLHDTTQLPDAVAGYSYFLATKDTTIDSTTCLIIEGQDYVVGKDSIQIFRKRFAVHLSDSLVAVYAFHTGDVLAFNSGVMKAGTQAVTLTTANYSTSATRKVVLPRLLAATGYDTSVFFDFVCPIVYPLRQDSTYVYRDSSDPRGNTPMRRTFRGVEDIQVPAGDFQAYKLQYDFGFTDSARFYDWVGQHGLLKRYYYIPNDVIYDTLGVAIDSCDCYGIYELVGNSNINPDTLVPWGRR
jgi:hypothetical protein